MDKKDNYGFKVTVIKNGQPRPYADSEYEYEIEAENCSEYTVKSFCQTFLRPKKQTYNEWAKGKDSAGVYFGGYYTFQKVAENKYLYYVKEPFCD